ncbi:MAG: ATP-binding cassette domain-containing protein, partial [Tissierellaceae bacterium]
MENSILSVKNVSMLYGSDKNRAIKLKESGLSKDEIYEKTKVTIALWNTTFDVRKGEIFVVIGLSGSGKSTLVRCFNRLNRPTSGSVYFEGRDIGKFNKDELNDFRRSKISMVFQQFGLMSHRT